MLDFARVMTDSQVDEHCRRTQRGVVQKNAQALVYKRPRHFRHKYRRKRFTVAPATPARWCDDGRDRAPPVHVAARFSSSSPAILLFHNRNGARGLDG